MRLIVPYKMIEVLLLIVAFILLALPDQWCTSTLQFPLVSPIDNDGKLMESTTSSATVVPDIVVYFQSLWTVEQQSGDSTSVDHEATDDDQQKPVFAPENTPKNVLPKLDQQTHYGASKNPSQKAGQELMTNTSESRNNENAQTAQVNLVKSSKSQQNTSNSGDTVSKWKWTYPFFAWLEKFPIQISNTTSNSSRVRRSAKQPNDSDLCVIVIVGSLTDDFFAWRPVLQGKMPQNGPIKIPELLISLAFALVASGIGAVHLAFRHGDAVQPWETLLNVAVSVCSFSCGLFTYFIRETLCQSPQIDDGGSWSVDDVQLPSHWLTAILLACTAAAMAIGEIVFGNTLVVSQLCVTQRHYDLTRKNLWEEDATQADRGKIRYQTYRKIAPY